MPNLIMQHAPPEGHWREDPVICAKCHGTNIHTMMWVDTKTGKVDWSEAPFEFESGPDGGIQPSFCLDCDAYHGTASVSVISDPIKLLAILGGSCVS